MPWLSQDVIALAVRNLHDAAILAGGSVTPKPDTLMSFNFEVSSQTVGGKRYLVRLQKSCVSSLTTTLRSLISCGCPGYTISLAKSGADEVCKHCGAVLLCCLKTHRRPSPLSLPIPQPRPIIAQGRAPLALTDAQPSKPGPEPAAGAAVPSSVFTDYDSKGEEAAELLKGGGRLLSVLSAKQAQRMAVYLLSKAVAHATLSAFTFDLLMVTEALNEAAARGVAVKLLVDGKHSLGGTTAMQMDRLDLLRDHGVEVYLTQGVSSTGIQHSKSLLVDRYFMIGSTNWTNSSRNNHELSVLIELADEGAIAVETRLQYMKQGGKLLTKAQVTSSQALREERKSRPKSVEPKSDRYATAKRFSIARSRSLNRV